MNCPCHSKQPYASCCRPYHKGKAAPTPLALMRSRYCAYALGLSDYTQETTHLQSPHYKQDKSQWRQDILAFCKGTQFVGLEILEAEGDKVTFRAELRRGGEDASFTERSAFKKEGGRWLYV